MQSKLAILLTPPAAAAIAVVRLHGPNAAHLVQSKFSRKLRPGHAVHGELRDGGSVIDDPVAVLDPEGRFVDLSVHGGTWIVHTVLEWARRDGFELSRLPMSPAAVDGQSLLETELLTHLPLAITELALRSLLAQPCAWQQAAKEGSRGSPGLQQILADRSLHWLLNPPRLAIVGAPNVGKSTLANQLFAQERSITADLPGTTRDWVGEIANLDGLAVMLVDTPGIRATVDMIEAEAISGSENEIQKSDLVVLVLDATQPLEPGQSQLCRQFPGALLVTNKTDRSAAWDIERLPAIRTVATTGAGVDPLRTRIRQHFGIEGMDVNQPRCWTSRQREVLASRATLEDAIDVLIGHKQEHAQD